MAKFTFQKNCFSYFMIQTRNFVLIYVIQIILNNIITLYEYANMHFKYISSLNINHLYKLLI